MTTSTSSTDYGRVENDGTVLVKMPDGSEKQVGQWAAGDPNDGLTFYIRKFHEIENELSLTLQRLKEGKGNAEAAFKLIERVKTNLENPTFVGDLSILSTTGNTSVSKNWLHMSRTINCSSLNSSGMKTSSDFTSLMIHSPPWIVAAIKYNLIIYYSRIHVEKHFSLFQFLLY